MQLQSHPFHSLKGRMPFLHWFLSIRKFWVVWFLLCKACSFITNSPVFLMSWCLGACLCETVVLFFSLFQPLLLFQHRKEILRQRNPSPPAAGLSPCRCAHMHSLFELGNFQINSEVTVQQKILAWVRVSEHLMCPLPVCPAFLVPLCCYQVCHHVGVWKGKK